MEPLPEPLLLGGVGRLKQQDGLDERQDGEGLRQGMAGEEDQRLGEHAGPDEDYEQED